MKAPFDAVSPASKKILGSGGCHSPIVVTRCPQAAVSIVATTTRGATDARNTTTTLELESIQVHGGELALRRAKGSELRIESRVGGIRAVNVSSASGERRVGCSGVTRGTLWLAALPRSGHPWRPVLRCARPHVPESTCRAAGADRAHVERRSRRPRRLDATWRARRPAMRSRG